ncbi:hypothetical protein WG906_03140 [Pedobacter sp. P351]|uniref:hypothetical protein n=1 Tax=Pedobacter superstes TaxID=3133441 RepID=UPI0030A3C26C
MNRFKTVLTLILLSSLFISFYPEELADKLGARLGIYLKENPSTNLYLHLDKVNYLQTDTIWFKAYVLSGDRIDNQVLYVRLTDHNNKIVLRRQFMMYDIRAHGDLIIPPAIKEGSYTLYAYTDRMINFNERDVFEQPITIRRDSERRLEANAFVKDTTKLVRGSNVQIAIQIKEGIKLLKYVKGTYQLLEGEKILKSGKVSTDLFGEATVNFTYPQLADDKTLRFKANFKDDKEYAELVLNLPHEGNKLTINLYPEGGHLINGSQSKVILEAVDVNGNPVSTAITLFDGNSELYKVTTNKQGYATIIFSPRTASNYRLETAYGGKKKSYEFRSRVETAGYSLTVRKVPNEVTATIKNINEAGNALAVLRSGNKIILSKKISLPKDDSTTITFSNDSIPESLLSLALFDQSGQLRAERIFFNRPNNEHHLEIKTDAKMYGTRKKVTVTFNASDNTGSPVASNLSVAVVEKNSIDPRTFRTILHSLYYKAVKGNLAPFVSTMSEREIDDLLITRRWWNDWQKITTYVSKGHPEIFPNTGGVFGAVFQKTKKKFDVEYLKLSTLNNAVATLIPVAENQTFSIPPEQLIIDDTDEWLIRESGEFRENCNIMYFTHDRTFDKKVLTSGLLNSPILATSFVKFNPVTVNGSFRKAIRLKEVKIGAKAPAQDFQEESCTDFVCSSNILNCPNDHTRTSPGSITPEIGKKYLYRWGSTAVYYGCDDYHFKSIAKPHMFFAPDFESHPEAEPKTGTTIFWRPNTGTPKNGTNSISFFSSDMIGDFIIIAQGINVNDLSPLYGSAVFSLK